MANDGPPARSPLWCAARRLECSANVASGGSGHWVKGSGKSFTCNNQRISLIIWLLVLLLHAASIATVRNEIRILDGLICRCRAAVKPMPISTFGRLESSCLVPHATAPSSSLAGSPSWCSASSSARSPSTAVPTTCPMRLQPRAFTSLRSRLSSHRGEGGTMAAPDGPTWRLVAPKKVF